MKPPRIRVPGVGAIPPGYLVGRQPGGKGRGAAQLIAMSDALSNVMAGVADRLGAVASGTLQNRFALGNTTSATSSFANTLSIFSVSGMGAASAGFDTNGVLIISAAASGTTAASAASMNMTAIGNTTGSSSATTRVITAMTLSGAGGVSLGYSGNSIIISGATTAAQSVQTLGLFAVGNTAGSTTSITADARTLSFEGSGVASVGFSNGSVVINAPAAAATNPVLSLYAVSNTTDSTTSGSNAAGSLSFAGAGGVSVGLSGSSVIISGATTVASAVSMNMTAIGNTTGSSSATTRVITAQTFSGAGIISVGFSGNSIIISAATAATNPLLSLYAVGNTTTSASSGVIAAGSLSFDGAGAVSVGISGSSIIISAPATIASATSMGLTALGNTAGSTTSMTNALTAESISFAGGVSGGFSGGTLVISGGTGTVIGGIGTISHFSNTPLMTGTRSAFVALGTMHCCPVIPPSVVSFNHIGVLKSAVFTGGVSMTVSTSAAASFTATASRDELNTWAIGIWTNQSNGVTYTLQGSTTVPQHIRQSVSISQSAGSVTVSDWITNVYGGLGGSTTQDTFSATHSSGAGNAVVALGAGAAPGGYNAQLYFIYPWVSSMNTGVNFVGVGLLSTSLGTTTGTSRIAFAAATIWALGLSFGVPLPNNFVPVSSSAGPTIRMGYNILTSSAGSVMPGSIVLSGNQSTSSGAPFFNFNSW